MEESFYHRGNKGSTSLSILNRTLPVWILLILFSGCTGAPQTPETTKQPPPYGLIRESIEAGDAENALRLYREYLRSYPDSPMDRLLLARLLLAAGYQEDARIQLETLIEGEQPSVDALLTLGYLEKLAGNRDAERNALERALEIDNSDSRVLSGLGTLHLEAGEDGQAEERFRESLEVNPEDAAALRGMGLVLLNRENYTEAIETFDRAIMADPDNALNYSDRARAQAALKKRDEAVRDLSMAIQLDPGFYWNYIDRGRLYLQMRKFAEAESDLTQAIRIDSELFLPYVYRAGLYDRLDRREEAIDDYHRVLQLNPEYFFAHAPLGVLSYLEGNWEEAALAFQQAFVHEPEIPSYALLAALSWMQLEQIEEARTYLEARIRDFPAGSWPTLIARYYLDPALEGRTIDAANREQNKLQRGQMLFYIASALLLEDRIETALRYLILVEQIDRLDLPEKRIAEQLLTSFGYSD
jgi:tetratricopeptide (TPR) repeat protein